MTKEPVITFLKEKQYKLCVLATASLDGKPECAVVGYAVMDDLSIVISTSKSTRKVANLLENNKASIVCGWSFSEPNVQMDGFADVVIEGEEYEKLDMFFFSQNQEAKKFKSSETVLIHFMPSWVRFLDPTSAPPKHEEATLA